MTEKLIVGIIRMSVTGGLSIIVFCVLSWIFQKKYKARSRKNGWILIAVCLMFPLNLDVCPYAHTVQIPNLVVKEHENVLSIGGNEPESKQGIDAVNNSKQDKEDNVSALPETSMKISAGFSTERILFIIWSVGALLLTVYHLIVYRMMYRRVKKWSHDCQDNMMLKKAADIGGEIGLKTMPRIRILESPDSGPFTMGILKSIVFLPEKDFSEKDIYYVLKHELIHCREKDILWKLLFLTVNIVHWFNPFVWLMCRIAENDIEQTCDEGVLKDASIEEYREYSNVILAWVERGRQNPLYVGYVARTVFLKRRFANIYESSNKQSGKILVGAVCVVILLFGSIVDIERSDIFNKETLGSQQFVEYSEESVFDERQFESVPDEVMQQITLSSRIIADIPEQDLFLTYEQLDWPDYTGISLHYNGQILSVSGKTMADSIFTPSLHLFENDSKVAVVLVETEGTGLYITSLHLVDLEQFSEVPYEDALTYLKQNIRSSVEPEDGIVNLELPDGTLQFDVSGIESPTNLYDQVGYGGIVKYYIENDKICCDVHLHISPACNLGYIRLEYGLAEKEYKVSSMEFKEYSDSQ